MTREEQLNRIADKVFQLNGEADRATKKLSDVNEQLLKCGLGLEVWAPVANIGFFRSGERWGIGLRRGPENTHAINAKRSERIYLSEHIDGLLDAIEAALNKELESVTI